MSLLGIDIGTSYCVLATIQRGAVSIVRNDLSERLTPALVSFTDKERLIGEQAQTQIRSNFRNTARNIKQLLGITRANTEAFERESEFSLASLGFADDTQAGLAGYDVSYKGERQVFTATRCMAALLTKLKDIGEKSIGGPVHDVVISVPAWFSEPARQAMLDAAEIAGLNCLRAMNEHSAVALDYGIYRSLTFDVDKASRVAFVGIGHGSANVFVADFKKGELQMQAVSSDKTIGGRDLDLAIIKHFASQFQKKYNVDPLKNAKALLKLEDTATKAKKILSANLEAPFNIECLIDDYDITGLLTRGEFEQICEPFHARLTDLLKSTFEQNGVNPDTVDHVELIGGCTRIPWIQQTIQSFFKDRLPLSKTLNMDETVARGCALQAAMLNPRYRVREFSVVDRSFEPVFVSWLPSDGVSPEWKQSTLFEKGSSLGMKKWLTFQRSSGFEIRLTPGGEGEPLVTRVEAPATMNVDASLPKRFKVKARLSSNGIAGWEAAQLLVDEEVEELVKEKRPIAQTTTPADQPMGEATETPPAEQFEEVEVLKKKVKTQRFDCSLVSAPRQGYLEAPARSGLKDAEMAMASDDRVQQEAKEMMNLLETYVYAMRGSLSSNLSEFASTQEKETFAPMLAQTEDWIYDNIEGTRDLYANKLAELKALGDPIQLRASEFEARKEGMNQLSQSLSELRGTLSSPQWAHIEEGRMQMLVTKIADTDRWLAQIATQVNSTPLHVNVAAKASEIFDEITTLSNFAKTILVPKPEEPVVTEPEKEKTDAPMDDVATDSANTPDTDAPMP